MDLKETNQKENLLFKRKEVELVVESLSSPKNQEIEIILSEKYSVPAENIKIKKIKGNFGSNKFVIIANIYSSKQDKENTEIVARKLRKVNTPVQITTA